MAEWLSSTAFFGSLSLLLAVWLVYPAALRVMAWFYPPDKRQGAGGSAKSVSVVIAAHNEASHLAVRVKNVFESDYPADLLEVIIASDGSDDGTPAIVDELRHRYGRVKLVEIFPQGGRSNAHNKAVGVCEGEVLLFTDAETVFEKNCVRALAAPFADDDVGFASGVLLYRNASATAVTQSVGLYWRFEYFLRSLESRLGVYAVGSGACCAARRSLYREIPPTGDVDFTTPIDVVLQGYRCVHVAAAIAHEVAAETPLREFRARVRMTAKNFHGTLSRWGRRGWFGHPAYSLVLLGHKIGRWLTPLGMLGLLAGNILVLDRYPSSLWLLLAQALFYLMGILGSFGLRVLFAGQIFSFLLANAAFLVGVIKALLGRVPKYYVPVRRS